MEQHLQLLLDFMSQWGYWAIGILMASENACIPIPSEVILGFAGYMVFMGALNFWGAVLAGIIGGIVGSIITYYIGLWGGRPFIDKYGKYFFIKQSHVNAAQRWFDKYGVSAVFFSRLLPVVRTFISLPAGFGAVNINKFIIYTFLGSTPWTILLIYLGDTLGKNWQTLLAIGHKFSSITCILLFMAGIFFLWRHYRNRKQTNL